ncbi:MAG: hypothetical protein ACRCYU_00590, partial [Nocardioides sp.]
MDNRLRSFRLIGRLAVKIAAAGTVSMPRASTVVALTQAVEKLLVLATPRSLTVTATSSHVSSSLPA